MSNSMWSHQAAVVVYPRLSFASHVEVTDEQNISSSSQTSPTTPRKATPNTSRRRLGTLNLTRAEATPSHRVKMANIFQEAAAGIQSMQRSPVAGNSGLSSASNTKRNRISLATYMQRYREKKKIQPKGSDLPFEHLANLPALRTPTLPEHEALPTPPPPSSTALPLGASGKEPFSSGFTSPVAPESYLRYVLPLSSSTLPHESDDEECHSTHGVPYIITPYDPQRELSPPQMLNIDAWLDKLMDPAPEPTAEPAVHSPAKDNLERSSPCRSLFSKKLRRPIASTKLGSSTITASQGTVQSPPLSAPPGGLHSLIPLDKFDPTARTSSNKENLPPPTTSPPWNSNVSCPPPDPPPTNRITPPTDYPLQDESPGLFLTPYQHIPRLRSASALARAKSPAKPPSSSLFLTPYLSAPPRRPSHPVASSPSSSPKNRNARSPPPSAHFHPSSPPPRRNAAFAICEDETPYHEVYGTVNDYRATGDGTPYPRTMDKSGPWAVDSRDLGPELEGEQVDKRDVEGDTVQLSPDVERYRKGRGKGRGRRERKRCGSYWDEDITLGVEGMSAGKEFAGEEYGAEGGGVEEGYEGDEEVF